MLLPIIYKVLYILFLISVCLIFTGFMIFIKYWIDWVWCSKLFPYYMLFRRFGFFLLGWVIHWFSYRVFVPFSFNQKLNFFFDRFYLYIPLCIISAGSIFAFVPGFISAGI